MFREPFLILASTQNSCVSRNDSLKPPPPPLLTTDIFAKHPTFFILPALKCKWKTFNENLLPSTPSPVPCFGGKRRKMDGKERKREKENERTVVTIIPPRVNNKKAFASSGKRLTIIYSCSLFRREIIVRFLPATVKNDAGHRYRKRRGASPFSPAIMNP